MAKDKTIFLSYSHQNINVAAEIDHDLKAIGITLIRDERELEYRDDIKEFMERVRKEAYVLMLISDAYLKSVNCMYEVLEFFKDDNQEQRILPIVLSDAKIYGPIDKIAYIKYWQDKVAELDAKMEGVKPQNLGDLPHELKLHQDIESSVGDFIGKITAKFNISWEKLKEENYKPILEYIGYEKPQADLMGDLIKIYQIKDREDQNIELDDFIEKNPQEPLGHFLKAQIAHERQEYKKAVVYYTTVITLKPDFAEAYNNRGNAYAKQDKYDQAIADYEKFIQLAPTAPASYVEMAKQRIAELRKKK